MEKKIYPSVQELTSINSTVRCTEEGCSSVFSSESNLTLHLAKTHKMEHLLQTDKDPKQYYCPNKTCIYNTNKFFKTLKLLKQHYLKVHSDKSFICEICNKGFPTQSAQSSHTEYCGISFKCIDCSASYPSYESLTTHARRKKHRIHEKANYKGNPSKPSGSSGDVSRNKRKAKFILPKGSISLQTFNVIDASKITSNDKSNQTDYEIVEKKICLSPSSSSTSSLQKSLSSVETQTVGDYVTNKQMSSSSDESLNRKSIKTQTKPVSSMTKSCNTSFNLNTCEFDDDVKVERNSSSTQTTTSVPTEFIYSTPIDTADALTLDTDPLFNCNIETQTDFMNENDFGSDYYINMYTQTCDEILLNDFGFNNNCTQTVFDEMLRSVESQTTMSQGGKTMLSCRDMAHTETQTDIEFKQILEEINA